MERLFQLVATVITHYTPQVGFGIYDGFDFHDELENVHTLVTCIVQSIDSQKELDNVLTCDFTVVIEQNSVTDVRSDHVCIQHTDSCLGTIVKIQQVLLVPVKRTFVAQSWLAIIALHVTQDRKSFRIEIVLVFLPLIHSSLALSGCRSSHKCLNNETLFNHVIIVKLVSVLVQLRISPIIHVWVIFCGRLWLRWKDKLEDFVTNRNIYQRRIAACFKIYLSCLGLMGV